MSVLHRVVERYRGTDTRAGRLILRFDVWRLVTYMRAVRRLQQRLTAEAARVKRQQARIAASKRSEDTP